MGIGDWIMAAGEAAYRWQQTGRRTLFRHPKGHVIWEQVFDGNPAIAKEPGHDVDEIVQGGGVRPYIAEKHTDRWVWRRYEPKPAQLRIEAFDIDKWRDTASRYHLLVEPSSKVIGHFNKRWPAEKWRELVSAMARAGLGVCQFDHSSDSAISYVNLSAFGVRQIKSASIMDAAAFMKALALSGAIAVLHEGGLHHVAAAVGLRSVVIYGGFISPEQTGYAMHRNLFAGGEPCGSRFDCPHCAAAMNAIKPIDVFAEAIGLLNEVSANGTR